MRTIWLPGLGSTGNNESAGKRYSGTTRHGKKALNTSLVQAAHAASRTRNTCLSSQYHRMAGRRGKKCAIVTVARSILVIIYNMIKRHEPYNELSGD
jgi:transposase